MNRHGVCVTDHNRFRVGVVGIIVFTLFGALLTRLWFLQVDIDSGRISTALERRSEREVFYEAPRGWIYDRNGKVIAQNKIVWVLKIDRRLTGDQEDQAIDRLAVLLDQPRSEIVDRLEDPRISPLEDALIAVDIPNEIRTEIAEHREDYPYIQVEQIAVREYPGDSKLASVIGFVSRVNQDDLDRHEGEYGARDTIGRGGIEAAMESVLRGERSYEKLSVNPAGEIIGDPIESLPGAKGNDVYLTIDIDLQAQVERSLLEGISVARNTQNQDLKDCCLVNFRAKSAAAVVMDVTNGEVLAMASLPSYDPNEFVSGVSEGRWLELRDKQGDPLFNRATKTGLAPGSTFKLMTAIAGALSGIRHPDTWVQDLGCYTNVTGTASQEFCNPNDSPTNGGNPINMSRALSVSSDTYFYEIGDLLWGVWRSGDKEAGDSIQNIARRLGFGEKTGIEIGESTNRVPDAKWRYNWVHDHPDDYTGSLNDWDDWNPADSINLAVGQGDLLVSPLQLVGAYSAFANGGSLWRPFLVKDVRDPDGVVVHSTEAVRRRTIDIPANVSVAVNSGLRGVLESGTAARAFDGFDLITYPIMGKTGTAQRSKYPLCATPKIEGDSAHTAEEVEKCLGDTSWFVAAAPANAPKYAVVVMVEEGGFGGDVAAPIARQIYEHILGIDITPIPGRLGDNR